MKPASQQQPKLKAIDKTNPKVNHYGSMEYWEERYVKCKKEERFDWLEDQQSIMSLIEHTLHHDVSRRVLNIGCGNGAIQDFLYEKGYVNIINNDISPTVIHNMNQIKEQRGYDKMEYHVGDVTSMKEYEDSSFDMVLDKSTLDALTCSDEPYIDVAKMLEEIYRVLRPNGIYLIISYSTPENRLYHLQRRHIKFNISMKELMRVNEKGHLVKNYVFICEKQAGLLLSEEERDDFYSDLKEKQRIDYPNE